MAKWVEVCVNQFWSFWSWILWIFLNSVAHLNFCYENLCIFPDFPQNLPLRNWTHCRFELIVHVSVCLSLKWLIYMNRNIWVVLPSGKLVFTILEYHMYRIYSNKCPGASTFFSQISRLISQISRFRFLGLDRTVEIA